MIETLKDLKWFVSFSYSEYIVPKGFKQHMIFFMALPYATYSYWKLQRAEKLK